MAAFIFQLLNSAFKLAPLVIKLVLQSGRPDYAILDASTWRPSRNFVAHSVCKAGLLVLTSQLALEFAPEITMNAVSTGPVLLSPDYTDEKNEEVARRTLLKRWGTPQDVVDATLFLVQANLLPVNSSLSMVMRSTGINKT